MKNKLVFLFLALAMLVGMSTTAVAKDTGMAKKLASELTVYYENYQETAETDMERVLAEIKSADKDYGEAWEKILDYWRQVNAEGFVNVGVVPQGLPQDDSLCIVILGYALNDDGTMREELVGRLETGLAIAREYPNAYVCVTGGGSVPNFTEGDLMGQWLLEQGLDENRLIVENASVNTVENATFTYKLLKKEYEQINKVILVTSDYHIPRGSILYYTKFVLGANSAGGEEIQIVANAGFDTGMNGSNSLELQAQGVRSVAGIGEAEVTLSLLDTLTVTQDAPYIAGNELDLTVEANYDSGYSKAVNAVITGFDESGDANQTVTVSYTENDITIAGEMCLAETKTEMATCQVATRSALFSKLQRPGTVYVKLGTDIELTYSSCKIPEGTTAILDLNGHSIASNNGTAAYLQNDGNLVIWDSSAEQTGSITITGASQTTALKCILNKGTLTIEGGTFVATNDSGDAHIFSGAEGNITVSGGTFQADVTAYLAEGYTQLENGSVEKIQNSQNGNILWIILPSVLMLLLAVVLVAAKKKKH